MSLLPLVLAASISYADNTAVRKAIQTQYAAISKSFAERDVLTFEDAFTSDFTAKSPGRPLVTRKQFIKDFEGQMMMMSDVKWTQTIRTLKLQGSVAHTVSDSQMTAKVLDSKGKKRNFRLESKGTKSDWVKISSEWKIKKSETVDLRIWIDGKPLKRA